MANRIKTLRSSSQIKHVFNHGYASSTPYVTVFACKHDEVDGSYWAIVASKRVGNAIVRNRAKRVLRVAVTSFMALYIHAGFHFVVLAKPGLLELSHQEMLRMVHQTIQRAQYRACGNEVL